MELSALKEVNLQAYRVEAEVGSLQRYSLCRQPHSNLFFLNLDYQDFDLLKHFHLFFLLLLSTFSLHCFHLFFAPSANLACLLVRPRLAGLDFHTTHRDI
jgi:hypothetical protein